MGNALWKLGPSGPVLVSDFPGNATTTTLAKMIRVNDSLFFRVNDSTVSGVELWRYDLNGGAAALVKDIRSGTASSSPDRFTAVGNTLYFTATTTAEGTELYKTDGTTAGTLLVKDIFPGTSSATPSFLTALNGALIFQATTAAGGAELWRSDGTSAGTIQLAEIGPGTFSGLPRKLTDMGGYVLFEAGDGNSASPRNELWRTDGTSAGTYLVKRIGTLSLGSNPQQFINIGGRLYFQARDPVAGMELFTSDGTSGGTVMVDDVEPGSASSTPRTPAQLNGALFFVADGSTVGTEMWTLPGAGVGGAYVAAAASVYLASGQHLINLNIEGNASVASGGGRTIVTRALALPGTLDLADDNLILDYSGVSPIATWNGSAYTSVVGLVASGHIVSSLATPGMISLPPPPYPQWLAWA